jgi:hypothetical protein
MTSSKSFAKAAPRAEYARQIICFAQGSMIRTPQGERRIEHLQRGDFVLTQDDGPQPIRWIGRQTVRASGALAPVRFARGALGNDRDLLVSPQHRMLVGQAGRDGIGQNEVLVPALALVDDFRITIAFGGMVTYHHMMFDRHQLVMANGVPSESFHPGGIGLETLAPCERDELFTEFPLLRTNVSTYGPASRPCLPSRAAG